MDWIKRYEPYVEYDKGGYTDALMRESNRGDYVLFTDHAAAVARLEAERDVQATLRQLCDGKILLLESRLSLAEKVVEAAKRRVDAHYDNCGLRRGKECSCGYTALQTALADYWSAK